MKKKRKSDFFRKEILDFVNAYCFSGWFSTLEECAEAYGMSVWMAKQLIYLSISECIVENDVVEILFRKAYQSACTHAFEEGIYSAPSSTYAKYRNLKEARKSFEFSDAKTVELVLLYLASGQNRHHFCQEQGITKSLWSKTLKRAIVQNLISDEMVNDLHQKALTFNSDEDAVNALFTELTKEREEYLRQHP